MSHLVAILANSFCSMGLCYGTYYSFFESLPLVYPVMYNFSAESTGLVFLVVAPAGLIAFTVHCIYLKYRVFPRLMNGTFGELENHLLPGLFASPIIFVGLFLFGKLLATLMAR
jgi:DHA1 family multidrug resistance protein-like MFS transporter